VAPEQMMHIFDITTETKIFGVPRVRARTSGNFCSRADASARRDEREYVARLL
jgi:hypothetical protein